MAPFNDAARPHDPADAVADGLDRRQALRRLAVGAAVVWTAPLISRTASAASATSCTNHTLDWNGFTAGDTFSSTNVGGVTVTLAASTFFGGTTALGTNRTIRTGPQGDVEGQALRFEQTPNTGGGQVITLDFSQTVYSVSFTITDIDNYFNNQGNGWSDRIEILSPASFTGTPPSGSSVIGAGTEASRYRNSETNENFPNDSNAGNIDMLFPGPLTQIQLAFRCGGTDNGPNQLINILNIGFCS